MGAKACPEMFPNRLGRGKKSTYDFKHTIMEISDFADRGGRRGGSGSNRNLSRKRLRNSIQIWFETRREEFAKVGLKRIRFRVRKSINFRNDFLTRAKKINDLGGRRGAGAA